MNAVFLHGAGRAGVAAWPAQVATGEPDWVFLDRSRNGDRPHEDAARIINALEPTARGHVVAHSYGANAALIAAQRAPELVASLTLLEPACLDVARGKPAVVEHISAMTPVFAAADDASVSAREFSSRFASAMGTEPPNLPQDVLEAQVARLRALPPPWDTGVNAVGALPVRTLVVTGAWNEMYEQIADALVSLGADHVTLSGNGHRVQDAPEANDLLRQFWGQAPGAAALGDTA
jgi:pimeloyl-ACP methyl ester carboxylesterase